MISILKNKINKFFYEKIIKKKGKVYVEEIKTMSVIL
jgi:hypothetical protein